MVKACRICKLQKDETEFYLRKDTGNPNLRRRTCKQCLAERNRLNLEADGGEANRLKCQAYYNAHRQETAEYNHEQVVLKRRMIADAKAKPCTDCGREYPHYVMDFDHVPGRGQKVAGVSRMVNGSYSVASVEAEIKKCDLVCSNCHRIRTHRREYTRDFARSRLNGGLQEVRVDPNLAGLVHVA